MALRMMGDGPTKENRGGCWFLEGMLDHHGGALISHDARAKSTIPPNPLRFASGG